MCLLTAKPTFYVANMDEASIGKPDTSAHFRALEALAKEEGARLFRFVPLLKRKSRTEPIGAT